MAKVAKKAAPKKGKYFDNYSPATHDLKTNGGGSGSLATSLQPHTFGMLGWHLNLPGYALEVRHLSDNFYKFVWEKKSLL